MFKWMNNLVKNFRGEKSRWKHISNSLLVEVEQLEYLNEEKSELSKHKNFQYLEELHKILVKEYAVVERSCKSLKELTSEENRTEIFLKNEHLNRKFIREVKKLLIATPEILKEMEEYKQLLAEMLMASVHNNFKEYKLLLNKEKVLFEKQRTVEAYLQQIYSDLKDKEVDKKLIQQANKTRQKLGFIGITRNLMMLTIVTSMFINATGAMAQSPTNFNNSTQTEKQIDLNKPLVANYLDIGEESDAYKLPLVVDSVSTQNFGTNGFTFLTNGEEHFSGPSGSEDVTSLSGTNANAQFGHMLETFFGDLDDYEHNNTDSSVNSYKVNLVLSAATFNYNFKDASYKEGIQKKIIEKIQQFEKTHSGAKVRIIVPADNSIDNHINIPGVEIIKVSGDNLNFLLK